VEIVVGKIWVGAGKRIEWSSEAVEQQKSGGNEGAKEGRRKGGRVEMRRIIEQKCKRGGEAKALRSQGALGLRSE
jgi:hypothetical protein